jgi:hypothetical protein
MMQPGAEQASSAPGHLSQNDPVLQGVFVNLDHIVQIGTPGIGESADIFLGILGHDFQILLFDPQLVETCWNTNVR